MTDHSASTPNAAPSVDSIRSILRECVDDERRYAFSNYDDAVQVLSWLAEHVQTLIADRERYKFLRDWLLFDPSADLSVDRIRGFRVAADVDSGIDAAVAARSPESPGV